MKKIYFFWLIFLIVIMSYIGIKLYNNRNKKDQKAFELTKIQETISEEEKVSPNSKLVLKTYYTKCSHTKIEEKEMPIELINKTQNEVQEQYKEWKIEKFNREEIVLIKNEQDFCGEHYILRDDNGYVNVYRIEQSGHERKYLSTEISTLYLPETDQINLENGIYIYGKENLIEILQDFE